MTARFSKGGADRVTYTASAPPVPSVGITVTAWVRLRSDRNDFSTFLRMFGTSTTLTLCTFSDGTTPTIVSTSNTSGVRASTASLVVGEWYRVAVTVQGTTGTLYVAAGQDSPTLSGTGTVSGGSTTPTGLALGGRAPTDATQYLDGDLAYPRLWSAVLTQAQIEDEWKVAEPIVTTSLWAHWPLTANLLDTSGHSRDLVEGTMAPDFLIDDEPPLGGPTPPRITNLAVALDEASATATITAEDDQGLTGAVYTFDWGDGSTPSVSTLATASHTYLATGLYAVLVTVTDDTGLTDEAATAVDVVVPVTGQAPANSTVVTVAWLRTIPGLENIVSTVLPDPAKWADTGFVTVTTGTGGTAHAYYPEREPVMTVHAWATNAGSKKVPKGMAATLIERVVSACYAPVPRVDVPAKFKPVFIEYVEPVFEIGEVPEPKDNFAHYTLDIRIGWIEKQPVG